MLPVPEQVGQVLAIWKPLSKTNVLAPDPPQDVQVDRLAPGFNPVPEQVPQLTTGVMLIVCEVPLHASMKEMFMDAVMSFPRVLCRAAPGPPPPKAEPNNVSKRSA